MDTDARADGPERVTSAEAGLPAGPLWVGGRARFTDEVGHHFPPKE